MARTFREALKRRKLRAKSEEELMVQGGEFEGEVTSGK